MSYVNQNNAGRRPCACPQSPCDRPPRDVFYNGPVPPDPDPCGRGWASLLFLNCVLAGNLSAPADRPIPLDGDCSSVSGAFRHCDCGIRFGCSGTYLLRLIVNLPPNASVNTVLTLYLDGEPIYGGRLAILQTPGNPRGSYVLETTVHAPAGSDLTLMSSAPLNLSAPSDLQPIISLSLLKIG